MEIRHMRQTDDRLAISHIYEESWKFAYKDIIPRSYLEGIPAGQWASRLDEKDRNTLVMLENGMIIGTSSYGKSRYAAYEGFGEIISIYLLPEYIGRGYGRKLLDAVTEELVQLGYSNVFLWVLEENHRARMFYEKAGFIHSGEYLDTDIGGKELREMQYCRRKSI